VCVVSAATEKKVNRTAKLLLGPDANVPAVALRTYPFDGRSTRRLSKVAIPATAATIVVP
jgi:hypothetical protein